MALRSNIIFDPISSIEVFMDNVREVQSEHTREVLNYPSANVAEIKIHARHRMPTPWNYVGSLQDDIIEKKRKMVYLEAYAENTIVVDGGNNNAVYGSTRNLRMANQNTSVCNIEFVQLSKGGISGQYYHADDCTSTGTRTADSDAVDGYADVFDADAEYVLYSLTQNDYELPEGEYKMFVRIKDSNQVSSDVVMQVLNFTDATNLAIDNDLTATADYAYLTLDFTVASDDVGDTIQFKVIKDTATANSISVNFLGFVKV